MSRTVLVTGASGGIGRATAAMFLEAGYQVAVTYRENKPDIDAPSIQCDLRDTQSVNSAFSDVEAAFGPVEIVVANAGVNRDDLVVRMDEDAFTDVLDTNLTGAFRVAKRAIKPMMKAKWGRLVFLSSAVGMRGESGQANYAASKAGLVGFARSLTHEYGSRGITSNVVAPGFTDTAMTAALSDRVKERMLDKVPAGRVASPEEVAAAVFFLASDAASYVNGAVLPVDGGAGMGH